MIVIREAKDRGHADYGWLDTRHSFSFGDYYDPGHVGFRALRVINDDRVAPGEGFPRHPHQNAEILTYVLEGSLRHRDSMGHEQVLGPGDVQRLSAGTGIAHSEHNASSEEWLRFLQIWIIPREPGLAPSYEQRSFGEVARGELAPIASPDGADGSTTIQADARVYVARLGRGDRVAHRLAAGRHAWVQVARGVVRLGPHRLEEGDGAALSEVGEVALEGERDAEVLVFDLA